MDRNRTALRPATTGARNDRRTFLTNGLLSAAAAILLVALPTAASADPISVTDMLGRQVRLPRPAQHVVLSEGRHILTLALLDKDPLALLAGWGNDLKHYSPATYEAVRKALPKIDTIPDVGRLTGGAFSMEAVLAAKPDLVIFTLYGPKPDGVDKLDAAGVPYVFVDFFREPLTNTIPSMLLLGKLLGREAQADAFVTFYQRHMNDIEARVRRTKSRPSVLFHVNPNGRDCCFTSGRGSMTDFIRFAGGESIGQEIIPGAIGQLNLEYVLAKQPDFYLAGGGSTVALNGLLVGPSVTPSDAKTSLGTVLATPGLGNLRAIRTGNAAGIWLFFFDNPLFFVGIEKMAKLFHPDAFSDIDPDKTIRELSDRFFPFKLEGTFWVKATGS